MPCPDLPPPVEEPDYLKYDGAHIAHARALIDKANECRTEGAIGFLVLAIEALCDELEEPQRSRR